MTKRRNYSLKFADNVAELSSEDDFPEGGGPSKLDKEIQVEVSEKGAEHRYAENGKAMLVCNRYICGEISEAETQACIPRMFASVGTAKNVFECDDRDNILTKRGFVCISLLKTDQDMFELTGVTRTTFRLLSKTLVNRVPDDSSSSKIPIDKRLFLLLSKLKTGLSLSVISRPLRISKHSSTRIFAIIVKALRVECDKLITWPSRGDVQKSMPSDFQILYPNCRVMIDSIEMPSETSNVYSRTGTIGSVKCLVGYTPNGMISFIWSFYDKHRSDCRMAIESGILRLIESGDQVVALKNFPEFARILENDKNCRLVVIPPSDLPSRVSEDRVQSENTSTLRRIRIHMEQTFRRLRVYEILDKFPFEMTNLAPDIVFVCGALANLQPRIPMPSTCLRSS